MTKRRETMEEREAELDRLIARTLRPGQVVNDVFTPEQIAAMRRAIGLPDTRRLNPIDTDNIHLT